MNWFYWGKVSSSRLSSLLAPVVLSTGSVKNSERTEGLGVRVVVRVVVVVQVATPVDVPVDVRVVFRVYVQVVVQIAIPVEDDVRVDDPDKNWVRFEYWNDRLSDFCWSGSS